MYVHVLVMVESAGEDDQTILTITKLFAYIFLNVEQCRVNVEYVYVIVFLNFLM